MPGRFTMEAIFLLRCLMEKYQVVYKNLHLVFVDLEKSHYRLPKEIMWWLLGMLAVDEQNEVPWFMLLHMI